MPRKFDFVSPGIVLNEVDESVLPAQVTEEGPLIIGRSLRGPAGKPVRVSSLQNFYDVFGKPITGKGSSNSDVWRDGNTVGPTYAVFAAQAHLASNTTPVTFVRLLGQEDPNRTATTGQAGWYLAGDANTNEVYENATAYGLFIVASGSLATTGPTGSLCAIFYASGSAICLSGTLANDAAGAAGSAGVAGLYKSVGAGKFKIRISSSSGFEDKTFSFDPANADYIRNQFNTNPQKLEASTNFGTSNETYFLGETYEQAFADNVSSGSATGDQFAVMLPLQKSSGASNNFSYHLAPARAARSGWFINRKQGGQQERLFRLIALSEGEEVSANIHVEIADLRLGNRISPNSSFTVKVMQGNNVLEQFSGCNLDPSSPDYIAKKVGDQYLEWDNTNKKYNVRGDYANASDYVYVEVDSAVTNQLLTDKHALPVGFYGPLRHKGFTLAYGSAGAQLKGDGINTGVNSTCTITYTTGPMASSDHLTFAHPDLGDMVINFVASTGTHSTTFSSNAASIFVGTADDADKTATAVSVLLNSLQGYTASASSNVVTFTANSAGSHFTISFSETDSQNRQTVSAVTAGTDTDDQVYYLKGNAGIACSKADSAVFVGGLPHQYTASFEFPSLKLTSLNSNGGTNYRSNAVFGVRHNKSTDKFRDSSYKDITRYNPALPENDDGLTIASEQERAFVFTMEDLAVSEGLYYHSSGSATYEGTLSTLFDAGVKQFAAPLLGGFDGIDIKKTAPFAAVNVGSTERASYVRHTLEKALDAVADVEVLEYDLLTMPGMTHEGVSNRLIEVCETRGDALAIVDLEGTYEHTFENNGAVQNGSVDTVVATAKSRLLNSSFAASYYPSVKLRDSANGNGDVVVVPPSVAAVGAIAKSQGLSEPWFAPAGFNRGGINELGGSQGPRVVGTTEHLTKAERDDLYEQNINPIARFPASGDIVIFGQKTLSQVPSALDRINVRRLLLFLKRRIGKVAETILFDQNVNATWNRFKAQADKILSDVQSRLGITEYKLVLDETTTTADLVDRNILYAKVLIKPARAIEFIVVDFVVTRSGIEL
jgi:phage tail sheath protein FI